MDYKMMPNREEECDGVNNNLTIDNDFCSNDSLNNISNHQSTESQNTAGMSKAELRKSNKPIMEKRRRARINHCLNELKSLILEAMKKDPARHSKLEKADILEMTVKHLQSIQRHQLSLAIQTDPTVIHRFKSGFLECAEEVKRYVGQLEGIDSGVKQRLANHLNSCSTSLEQIGTFSNFSSGYRANSNPFGSHFNSTNSAFPLPQDVNNNGRLQMGGVQLIPSRLPSGELALIMPNSTSMPFFMPNMQSPSLDFSNTFSRMSAFSRPSVSASRPTATQTATTASSPPLSPVSSISSLGEDSMHTSSDFLSKTPPLAVNQSFSNAFPTPPSAESIKFVSHTSHLQQPFVSSTSEPLQTLREDNEELLPFKKRLRSDDSEFIGEPAKKVLKVDSEDEKNGNVTSGQQSPTEGSNDMWRPW